MATEVSVHGVTKTNKRMWYFYICELLSLLPRKSQDQIKEALDVVMFVMFLTDN